MPDIQTDHAQEREEAIDTLDTTGLAAAAPDQPSSTSERETAAVGMKFALTHLSGSYQGVTQYFERPHVTIGSALGVDHHLRKLVHDIAGQGGIRPLVTQWHISDVVPNRIVYDAQTTAGGSGSPVFNRQGELIAIHAAIMTRFGAVGFGVPITRALALLSPNG